MATSNYNLAHSQNKELGFNDFVNNKRRFEQTAATIKYYDQLFTPHEEIARLINCKLSDFEDLYLMAYANSPSDFSKTGEFSGRDQKLILLLHKTGKTLDEISHTLGCSHGKAIWQIHKLFLDYQTDRDPKSPFTSEDLEAFEHLAFLEVPIEQVAEQLNCSESEAQRAIDEVFLSYNSKREKRARLWLHDRIVLQHLKEIGISQRQIAEHLNCSPAAITYELKRCPENEYNAYEAHKDYLSKLHQERGHYKIEQTREFLETFSEEFNKKECSPESFAKFHYVHTESPFYDPSRRLCANTLYKYIHEEAYGLDQSCLAYGFKEEKSTIDFEGRQHKRLNGKSIAEFEEPEVHNGVPEFFVWEIDSIIGKKEKGQVILNILESSKFSSN